VSTTRRHKAAGIGAVLAAVPMTLVVGIAAIAGGLGGLNSITTATCDAPPALVHNRSANTKLDAAQLSSVQIIHSVGAQLHLPQRASIIAIATAMQESGLRNIGHGDKDSLGLFQQRPSQGWGTPAQIMNPVHAATSFFDHLIHVPHWQTMPLTQAAQAVQRSRFPGAYAKWESLATKALTGTATSLDTCTNLAGASEPSGKGAIAVQAAMHWLGTPYSWGGGGPNGPTYGFAQGAGIKGFDCSGLTQYAWHQAGIDIDRTADAQYDDGPHVPRDQLRPGDLLFFAYNTSDPRTIHHVGIYVGNGKMVNAPQTGDVVKISQFAGNSYRETEFIGATRPK